MRTEPGTLTGMGKAWSMGEREKVRQVILL